MRVALLLVAFSGSVLGQTPDIYLASQRAPNFAIPHRLPHLTKWSYPFPSNLTVELAKNWGYCVDLGDATTNLLSNIQTVGTLENGLVTVARSHSWPVSVNQYRTFPLPTPDGYWVTNVAGQFIGLNGITNPATKVVSPEGQDAYWSNSAIGWAYPIAVVQSNVPITIVLNGGEYGMDVAAGGNQEAWQQDPRVQANTNGYTWYQYSSIRKAHQQGIVSDLARAAATNRELYIFYNTTAESSRLGAGWETPWAWSSLQMNAVTDLPSFESYYKDFNAGWTNVIDGFGDIGNPSALTRLLNSVGFDIALGKPLNYTWFSGGWDIGGGTNTMSDPDNYTGFLKCCYTAGTIGGIAGFFSFPTGGFNAVVDPSNPPQWLMQIECLAHVHALFTHLENFLYNGDLLPGPYVHGMSSDQPAYEFQTFKQPYRVLSRKISSADEWLITAWMPYGTTNLSVAIPTLGTVAVTASTTGSVYYATSPSNVVLLDEYSFPSSSSVTTVNVQTAIFR